MEKRYVDDRHLPQQAASDREAEHAVPGQTQFAAQHAFALASTCEGVEHVEKHKAGEGHGGVAGADCMIKGHLADVYDESTQHYDCCGS